MQLNGTSIPDEIYTPDHPKAAWKPTGEFKAEGIKNPRYTYERTVEGQKQKRWFKPADFIKLGKSGKAPAPAE